MGPFLLFQSVRPKSWHLNKLPNPAQRWAFIGDNFLSIIVIAQNSLDLSITVIAFVIYFVIAINDFSCTQCLNFKS